MAGGLPGHSFNEADLEEQTEGFAAHAPQKVEIPKATLIHKIHGPSRFAKIISLITLLSLALFRPLRYRSADVFREAGAGSGQ